MLGLFFIVFWILNLSQLKKELTFKKKGDYTGMRQILNRASSLMLTVMLVMGFAFPLNVFGAGGNPNATASDVQYIEKDGKKTGIKSINIDPYTYVNLSQSEVLNPNGDATMTLSKDVLRKIAQERLFPAWGPIAEAVFASEADQFCSIYADNMMSKDPRNKDSFVRQFAMGKEEIVRDKLGYYEDWTLWSLGRTLANKNEENQGEINNDYSHSTGIVDMASLDAARTRMGQELRNASDDDDVSRDDFLANKYDKNNLRRRLTLLEQSDSGYGFANIVTCVNRAGKSANYDYVTFGLMIYDFQLIPIAANNLSYIEAAQDYINEENPIKAAKEAGVPGVDFDENNTESVKTVLKNPSMGEATQTVTLENSVTEEVSNTLEQRKDYSREESVGGEVAIGDCCGTAPRVTINTQFTWQQMWGSSKSDTNTKSTTNTRSISTELTMPQHTVANVVQNVQDTSFKESYQTPTILSYKVAIFGMSGDYFNGAVGGIHAGAYDKQYFAVILQGTEDGKNSGHEAIGALYNRVIRNKGVNNIDTATGDYQVWCDRGSWHKSEGVHWGDVATYLRNNKLYKFDYDSNSGGYVKAKSQLTGEDMELEDFCKEIPILEKASILSGKKQVMTSSVSSFEPMYDLKKVFIKPYEGTFLYDTRNYTLNPGTHLPLDNIVLEGKNADNWDYHGFDQYQMGHWICCDENGEPRTQTDEDVAQLTENEPGKGQRILTATSVDKTQTYWFKWVLNDDEEITSYESPNGIDHSTVEVPMISVVVRANSSIEDYDTISLKGSYSGLWTEKVNLPRELQVTNSANKEIPIYWQSMGSGITVDEESGEAVFSGPGTYKVRAYGISNNDKKIYSDFVDITAIEESKLDHFTLTAPNLTDTQRTMTKKKPSLEFNASQWISFFDQYDKVWLGDEPAVSWSVDDEDIASVDDTGNLTVTGPGSVTVTASVEGLGEQSVSFVFLRDKWLEELVLEEPDIDEDDLTLTDTVKQVRVSNLENLLKYYDVDGEVWTGNKPKITFNILQGATGSAIKSGNFVATQGGSYILQAETSTGIESNAILIEVKDESSLVLTTENPPEQVLTDSDHPLQVMLDKQVIAETLRGSIWYGDVPEMEFSLDNGTKNAKITKETIEDQEYNVFTCTQAGKYKVHVTPKNAGDYQKAIKDITITVTGTYVEWGPWVKENDTYHSRQAKNDTQLAQEEKHTWKGVLTGKSQDAEKPDIVKFTCTKCGAEKTETAAHEWSEPTYTTDKTFEKVTAERHCLHEGCINETETVEIQIDSSVSGDTWTVVYSAKFKNPAFKEWKETDVYEGEQGAENPGLLKAKGKTVKIKASKLKKKSLKIKASKAIKITASAGKLSYKKVGVSPKKKKSSFKVNKKTGKITVKKGLKKGTYKLKIKVTAAGDKTYASKSKTVTCKIIVQ